MKIGVLLAIPFFSTLVSGFFRSSCSSERLLKFNPPALFNASELGYSQITIDTFNRVAFISGQTAPPIEQSTPGTTTTVEQQLVSAEQNLRSAIASLDASVDDIAKIVVYIVGYDSTRDIPKVVQLGISLGRPASTLIGVSQLAFPNLLVEIEANVVLSRRYIRMLRFRKCVGNTLL